MYTPKFFASEDEALARRIVADNAFGVLMTLPDAVASEMDISHLPMLWRDGGGPHGHLIGHVAKANPHGARLGGAAGSVAVFSGAHAYISPNWYANPALVPTWNYAAVHLHGMPRVIADEAGAIDILDTLVDAFESDASGNWSTAKLPEGVLVKQLRGIVAFEMPITRVETKVKMSQNRAPDDIAGVVAALDRSEYQEDRATADMMRELNGG